MNETQKQIEVVANFLREQTTLSLATAGEEGAPSATPLFYIVDEALALYWLSSKTSQHSRNLLERPGVAAAVHCNAKSWREIRGVQMRGAVSEVTDPQRRAQIVKAYCARFSLGGVFRLAIQRSTVYVLQPDFFRFIDNTKGFGSGFEITRPPLSWDQDPPRA